MTAFPGIIYITFLIAFRLPQYFCLRMILNIASQKQGRACLSFKGKGLLNHEYVKVDQLHKGRHII